MIVTLLTVHLLLTVILIGVILLQRSEGGALGIGGGPNSFLQGRGRANLLTRTTAILATAFLSTSLLLAVLSNKGEQDSIFDELLVQSQEEEQDSLLTGVPDLVFPELPDSTTIEIPDPTLSEDAESVVSEVPDVALPEVPDSTLPAASP